MWKKENDKWYFLHTGWLRTNDRWYYLDTNGIMQTGWQQIDGTWYLLAESGEALNGWQKVNDKWYYLDPANSKMVTGKVLIGNTYYHFQDNGQWIEDKKEEVQDDGTPRTAHFNVREMACHDGRQVPKKLYANVKNLFKLAEEVRAAIQAEYGTDKVILITSGYRPADYNARIGGAKYSQHIHALAMDIVVNNVSPANVYRIASRVVGNRGGVGKYNGFTHIDARGHRSRW